jgi:hypothetical protein
MICDMQNIQKGCPGTDAMKALGTDPGLPVMSSSILPSTMSLPSMISSIFLRLWKSRSAYTPVGMVKATQPRQLQCAAIGCKWGNVQFPVCCGMKGRQLWAADSARHLSNGYAMVYSSVTRPNDAQNHARNEVARGSSLKEAQQHYIGTNAQRNIRKGGSAALLCTI